MGDGIASGAAASARTEGGAGAFSDHIVFEPLFPDVEAPSRATEASAGYDVRAHLRGRTVRVAAGGEVESRALGEEGTLVLRPGETALVPLGFRARLPDGYEAQMRLRSSVAFRRDLVMPNAPGTIDADYPDEWLAMLRNAGDAPATIAHGERVAQVVLARYAVLEWREGAVAPSTSRAGGLGSTGTR
jgi:dUTP pyrophosphatase